MNTIRKRIQNRIKEEEKRVKYQKNNEEGEKLVKALE